jgi:hypothetical protein
MIKRSTMIAATLVGLKKANAEYIQWCGDWVSDEPVEGLVASHVARAFFEHRGDDADHAGVSLEENFLYLRNRALPKNAKKGKPHKGFARKQRADVVYWHNGSPKVAIEVKRGDGWTGVKKDLVRMRGLLAEAGPRADGSLVACIVCHYMVGKWTDDKDKIKRRIARRGAKFSAFLKEKMSEKLLLPIGANGSGSQFEPSPIRKITEDGSYRRKHAYFEVGCCYLLASRDTKG